MFYIQNNIFHHHHLYCCTSFYIKYILWFTVVVWCLLFGFFFFLMKTKKRGTNQRREREREKIHTRFSHEEQKTPFNGNGLGKKNCFLSLDLFISTIIWMFDHFSHFMQKKNIIKIQKQEKTLEKKRFDVKQIWNKKSREIKSGVKCLLNVSHIYQNSEE